MLLVEIAIVAHDASRREQLCNHLLMHVRILAEIERGKVKAKNLDRAPQGTQPRFDQRRALVCDEGGLHDGKVGLQLFDSFIRPGRRLSAPPRRFAGQLLARHREPGIHADQRAAIGFILTMGVFDVRSIGQRLQLLRKADEARRHRQFDSKLVEFIQIVSDRHLALTAQRAHQGIHIHIWVAVPVAANPGPHLQERRDVRSAQPFFQAGVKLWNLVQKARLVKTECVLDFVCDGQLPIPQEPRLPKLDDLRPQ